MQPIKSNITSTGKCLNPVTTKCVVWDGPDITCLDGTTLCKGQNVETTLFTLATKLCEIYTALSLEDINTCINNINDGTSVSIGPTSSIKEVFSAIIKKLCTLDGRVQTLEDTPCLEQVAIVPECLRTQATSYPSYNPVTFTLPLQYYAELVANSVCGLLIDITALQLNAESINQQIDDLWAQLEGCSSTSQNFVLPTCTYNWTVSPSGDPVTIQTAFSWLEADYCTLRGLLGSNSEITSAVNSQCASLASETTLAPGLGGTMSTLPGWSNNPTTVANAITNMWLTVCDMRSYISDVLSLCCRSMCDYLQVGFTPLWSTDGTSVKISFVEPTNPTTYEDGNIPPAPTSPWSANGLTLPPWALAQFPTASQTNVQFILDDGNGYGFSVSSAKKINTWAQLASGAQFQINFSALAPVGYDQTSINQTITITFDYEVIIGSTTKMCTFNTTLALPYICNAPKPYNCNGELEVTSTTGTNMLIKLKDLVEDTPIIHTGTATGPGSGTDTLEDTGFNFTGLDDYVVTITSGTGVGQCRYIDTVLTSDEIQLDSDWDTAPDNTSVYQIKNKHYSYAQWGPLGVTSFNLVVSVKTSNFDINDSSTWNTQVSVSVPPTTLGTSGYSIASGVLQGNTEYVVILSAVYPCGESELVSNENFNQIAASVSIQIGNPTNFVFSVLDVNATVEDVLSNNNALTPPNGNATNNTPQLYALALPQGANITQVGVTPTPASWLPPIGGGNNFCICGISTDPDNVVPGTTITNHDATVGLYRGYSVEMYQQDNLLNYIPIADSATVPYATNSLDDPTLQFPLNATPPPIIVDVPSTYAYNNLPIVARYDPTNYRVNTSPTFHKITLDLTSFSQLINTDPINSQDFQTIIRLEVRRWNSTTNQYESYAPTPKFITWSMSSPTSIGPSSNVIYPLTSPIWTTQTNTDGTYNELLCKYGDALYVWIADSRSIPAVAGQSNFSSILFSPDPASKFSCRVPTLQTYVQSGPMGDQIYLPWGQSWWFAQRAIITEDYIVKTGTISTKS